MRETVFDIEADGLLETVTKIHVLSVKDVATGEVWSTDNYERMRQFFLDKGLTKIGHNIFRYDLRVVKKILGIEPCEPFVDTLPLSWTLNFDRVKHGLESYGDDYGVPKPVITNWDSLTYEDYRHRCEQDVEINTRLWKDLRWKLGQLYKEKSESNRYIRYLNFKMSCAADQEALRWKLDVEKAQALAETLEALKNEKEKELAQVMPKVPVTKTVKRPKATYKMDGTLSVAGERWLNLCEETNTSPGADSITYVDRYEDANPNSNEQVKAWLYNLGWKPKTFKYVRDKKNGTERSIEQVRREGELCPSVVELAEEEPSVALLEGLTVLSHRLGVVKGFLDSVSDDGYLKAEIAGLTNTLRFKHAKPLVNIPSVDKPYGREIRELLIAPEGYVLCGSDMVSLEDTTKRHYIQPHDPEYVKEMTAKGYDPHLSLAVFSGKITGADYKRYQEIDSADNRTGDEREWYKSIKAIRKAYKTVNYSATYGVGAPKLARETGLSVAEAKELLEAFWAKNWAIRAVADGLRVKDRFGSLWVYNPVSRFWYSLRSEKDRFSTLNQGTGVFCFDNWLLEAKRNGLPVIGQFHDELIGLVKDDEVDKENTRNMLKQSVQAVNERLNMNFPLDVDVQFGYNYAEVH